MDVHTKRLALLDGAGFGWAPRHLVEADLERGALVLPLRPAPKVKDRFSIVRRALSVPGPATNERR